MGWCSIQLSSLDIKRHPRTPGRRHLHDTEWSDDGGFAWRVAVNVAGRRGLIPVKFARKVDAQLAADALDKRFVDGVDMALQRDSVIRQTMVEAMKW